MVGTGFAEYLLLTGIRLTDLDGVAWRTSVAAWADVLVCIQVCLKSTCWAIHTAWTIRNWIYWSWPYRNAWLVTNSTGRTWLAVRRLSRASWLGISTGWAWLCNRCSLRAEWAWRTYVDFEINTIKGSDRALGSYDAQVSLSALALRIGKTEVWAVLTRWAVIHGIPAIERTLAKIAWNTNTAIFSGCVVRNWNWIVWLCCCSTVSWILSVAKAIEAISTRRSNVGLKTSIATWTWFTVLCFRSSAHNRAAISAGLTIRNDWVLAKLIWTTSNGCTLAHTVAAIGTNQTRARAHACRVLVGKARYHGPRTGWAVVVLEARRRLLDVGLWLAKVTNWAKVRVFDVTELCVV